MHDTVAYFHHDIKPENLLVSKDVIKTVDLGQAREINDKPSCTNYITTCLYRTPEVLLHARYDSSVDMWAMGVIMFELFSLRPLFQGSSSTEVIRKMCSVIDNPTESTWSLRMYLANNITYRFPEFLGVDFFALLPSASPEAINLLSTLLSWSACSRVLHTCMTPLPTFIITQPENLLVSKDVINIADFGQAREINDKPPCSDYITICWYPTLEVLLHAQHDSSVDMWA
ncbi:hypothetical protein L6452_09414 [Arctium lappa]|uniref:Uncharacterized protein n=1 Tax=Arctium lappa TaxID=4217 RepID=A0ACB9DKB4_ARCLA|nr:hypothetical protein L6452_09414 [Arctium lappa]